MKLNNIYSVLHGLNNGQMMTKLVLLVALTFVGITSHAQCDNPSVGSFVPFVGKTNLNKFSGEKGVLTLAWIKKTSNCAFPFYVEWRKDSAEGEIIKSGYLMSDQYTVGGEKEDKLRVIDRLNSGDYYLVIYDSSENCKNIINKYTIE
jgi:hypothetical protein